MTKPSISNPAAKEQPEMTKAEPAPSEPEMTKAEPAPPELERVTDVPVEPALVVNRSSGYYVSPHCSVTSLKGILEPDQKVTARVFNGGEATLAKLVESGHVVKVDGSAPSS